MKNETSRIIVFIKRDALKDALNNALKENVRNIFVVSDFLNFFKVYSAKILITDVKGHTSISRTALTPYDSYTDNKYR